MAVLWYIQGSLTFCKECRADLLWVLRKYGCKTTQYNCRKGKVTFEFCGRGYYDFPEELATELNAITRHGIVDARCNEYNMYYRYSFGKGKVRRTTGSKLIYYRGFERDLLRVLITRRAQ